MARFSIVFHAGVLTQGVRLTGVDRMVRRRLKEAERRSESKRAMEERVRQLNLREAQAEASRLARDLLKALQAQGAPDVEIIATKTNRRGNVVPIHAGWFVFDYKYVHLGLLAKASVFITTKGRFYSTEGAGIGPYRADQLVPLERATDAVEGLRGLLARYA